jgi:hypothetical protein
MFDRVCYSTNCENRNDSDLVQAFLKKWWVESDFITAQTRVILEIVNIILFLINHAIYSVLKRM